MKMKKEDVKKMPLKGKKEVELKTKAVVKAKKK